MSESEKFLGENIKEALDSSKEKMLETDKDFVMLVTGSEGLGKSSLAVLMADYWDESFDVEKQVCMDHKDVIRTADELDEGQALVFDEGIEALLSRKHASKPNKIMLEWFREVRAKNLFIVVCMPEWKEIDKPIRDDRAHALVRIVKQGWCHFFNKSRMNQIEVDRRGNKKKTEFPDYLFRSGWKNPSNSELWRSYEVMKKENVSNLAEKYLDDKDEESDKWEEKFRKLRRRIAKTMVKNLDMTQTETAKQLGVSQKVISQWKTGGKWTNLPPINLSDSPKVNDFSS